jgi:hypothetical protein
MFPQNTTEQLLLNLEFSGPDNQHVIMYLLATLRQKNDEISREHCEECLVGGLTGTVSGAACCGAALAVRPDTLVWPAWH